LALYYFVITKGKWKKKSNYNKFTRRTT